MDHNFIKAQVEQRKLVVVKQVCNRHGSVESPTGLTVLVHIISAPVPELVQANALGCLALTDTVSCGSAAQSLL